MQMCARQCDVARTTTGCDVSLKNIACHFNLVRLLTRTVALILCHKLSVVDQRSPNVRKVLTTNHGEITMRS